MKYLKIIYYIFLTCIAAIAILLLVSVFNIPGNFKVLTVLSGSMEPAIKTGSVVVIKPSDNYQVGDIITFGKITKTQVPTTHRIVEIKGDDNDDDNDNNKVYLTKGDANNASDAREVRASEIIGKVLVSVPYAGYAVDVARKPVGFIFIIVVPAAIIVFDEIIKIIKEVKKIKAKKAEDNELPNQ